MRRALVLVALVSCAPRPGVPRCVEIPAPAEDEFAACGGMNYHAGPGPLVPFTVRFKSELSTNLVLESVCVLVDGYALIAGEKREWNGNLFRGRHVLKVRAVWKSGAASVTMRSAAEIVSLESGVVELIAHEQGGAATPIEKRAALRWVKPKGPTCE